MHLGQSRRGDAARQSQGRGRAAPRHPESYDDVDALLADPEINAVYIATPPGSHLEIALKVAAAGYPLYVEKPAARTAKGARRWRISQSCRYS